jgi:hypothetical protein
MFPLSPREIDFIKTYGAPLVKTWGYWQGRVEEDGEVYIEHIDFEERTKDSFLLPLQSYSDVVFRNIWNVCFERFTSLVGSDTRDKFDLIDVIEGPNTQKACQELLKEFLSIDHISKNVKIFLDDYEAQSSPSTAYGYIITALKALIQISEGNFTTANDVVKTFHRGLSELESDDDFILKTKSKRLKTSYLPLRELEERLDYIESYLYQLKLGN